MEIKLNEKLRKTSLLGIIRNFVSANRTTRRIAPASFSTVDGSLAAYEKSNVHLAHLAEVEIRRFEAIIETRNHILR